jgi:tellurite resistance protein
MRTFLAAPPISAFTMVMGISGLSLSWTKFSALTGLSVANDVALGFGLLAAGIFILLSLGLLRKQWQAPEKILEEWHHPVKSSFFATISVGMTLLAAVLFPYSHGGAEVLWFASAGVHLLAILAVLNAWVHRESLQAAHACPVWFIPAVGNAVIPVCGVKLGYIEFSWFFFGVGLILWFVILVVMLYRLMFVQPGLPERLKPTMAIFLAPPSVAFISWIALTNPLAEKSLDPMAHILIALALFFAAFLLTQFRFFYKLPFFMSWWAYSFPTASFATAMLGYATFVPEAEPLAYVSLFMTTVIIVGLFIRTLMAIHMKDPQWVD